MKQAATQVLKIGALIALVAQSGCAGIKENLKDTHPMEHHFGHVLFNESHQHLPALRPAGAAEEQPPTTRPEPVHIAEAPRARTLRPLVPTAQNPAPVTEPTEAPYDDASTRDDTADYDDTPQRDDPHTPQHDTTDTVAEAPREVPIVPRRPRAPKATPDRGLTIEPVKTEPTARVEAPKANPPVEAPKANPPVEAPTAAVGLGDGTPRGEALAAARRLVGVNTEFDEQGFLTHILQVADITLEAAADEDLVKALYDDLNKQDRVYGPSRDPLPGDIVFFSNTYDRDDDGRADDWFTMAGVVERIDGDGTVQLIGFSRGEIRRIYMNLQRPSAERNEASGKTLNSMLREKRLTDRPFTRYHAGELFASYGSLE